MVASNGISTDKSGAPLAAAWINHGIIPGSVPSDFGKKLNVPTIIA
jgi:hypothetical protein